MNNTKQIIIYDGECILCDNFINFVIKRDKKNKFHLAHLQSDYFKNISKKLNYLEPNKMNSVLYFKNNKIHDQSSAIIKIIADIGGIYKITLISLIIPKFLRNICYNFIGKRRYKWFGKKSCEVNNQEIIKRMVD